MPTFMDKIETPAEQWEPGELRGLSLLVERFTTADDHYWLTIGRKVLALAYWQTQDAHQVARALDSVARSIELREFSA